VVVGSAANGRIQTIDEVGAGLVSLLEVWSTVGTLAVAADDVKRFVAVVARVASTQGAGASVVCLVGARWGVGRCLIWRRGLPDRPCPASWGDGLLRDRELIFLSVVRGCAVAEWVSGAQ
jgi:hypothetical protein